jgi:starch synthase
VEPASTYPDLGLPPEWYGALEWVFPEWARRHALDKGEAVNFLKGAVVTADRIVTVSQVNCLYFPFFARCSSIPALCLSAS